MRRTSIHLATAGAGFLWATLTGMAAFAEDIELFVGAAAAAGRPNVLLIIDDSGSMGQRPSGIRTGPSKMAIVKSVAQHVVSEASGVNIGLMHFSQITGDCTNGNNNSMPPHGGPVSFPVTDVTTSRDTLNDAIDDLTASACTPLSETLYEAALYWLGRTVGNTASVSTARLTDDPNTYKSPIDYACQKNYVVLLTDGEPTADDDLDNAIESLVDAAGASIDSLANLGGAGCNGNCLDELAAFLYKGDLSPREGEQNVVTHTVGFDINLPLLAQTADLGGGTYYQANDADELLEALTGIVGDISEAGSTFVSPAVTVNSFNRTRNLNDLYISLFKPSDKLHWPGNLKKYRLRASDAAIIGENNEVAVSEDGHFLETARSYWTQGANDGPEVELGGAAHRIPAARKVYTYPHTGSNQLTSAANRIDAANADALFPDIDAAQRQTVVDFINGIGTDGQPRRQMGDPLHSQPTSIMYDSNVTIIYVATNDGFLHAIDAESGEEKWAFLPYEFLDYQAELLENPLSATRAYGIDGNLRIQTVGDRDGIIDTAAGEKVYLFFGMRRGGDDYYALDVTVPDQPKVLWHRDVDELPDILQSWSSPTPTKIRINGAAQNEDRLVVVFGGGYHGDDATVSSPDGWGQSIYIVDSESGELLWHGGKEGRDKAFGAMNYPIPADVKVIDFNGDGFADRMYAADLGGQVWRFDIYSGRNASDLVTGGVIATLGSAASGAAAEDGDDAVPVTDVNARRFFYSPDVALVTTPDYHFVHVGIGSGHREYPVSDKSTADRFYALRDYAALRKLTNDEYAAIDPITDDDLELISADNLNPTLTRNSSGWKLELNAGAGEKVLAEARTFNNQVFFTTFTPNAAAALDPCSPSLGTNRLYVMSVLNGAPVNNRQGEVGDPLEFSDIVAKEFQGTIASQVVFLFPSPEDPQNCEGMDCNPAPVACVDLFCMPTGFGNNPIRTFWRQENVD